MSARPLTVPTGSGALPAAEPVPPAVPVGYRRIVLRLGPYALAVRARGVTVAVAFGALLVVLGIAALGLGTFPLSPGRVLEVLLGGGSALDRTVVLEWRLPRALAAIVLGGLATALLIWSLARRGGVQGFRLIVIGIGIAAMLASANTWMLLEIELETAMFASAWGTGTLNGVTAGPLGGAIACAVPLLALLVPLAPRLRQLDLGDDVATATGARPAGVRTLALLVAVGLVSVSTAVIGPVAFIALAAPQVARRLADAPHLSMSLSALVGAFLLLASDLIAQHVLPVTLPVGVVTVSVGGLYLVLTLIQEIRRRA